MLKIEFQKMEFVFVGDSLEKDGAIATEEQYSSGELSYAHLNLEGEVRRLGEQIGTREDIKVLGEVEVKVQSGAFMKVLEGLASL